MTLATSAGASLPDATAASIRPEEAAHFGRMAAEWWDPNGSSAMLHRLGPVRLRFLRDAVDAHWRGEATGFTPLAGRTTLDVGCGAGLLAEPLARLGAAVTGVDAAPENIAAAEAHAALSGLAIDYRAGGIEDLDGAARFDLVTCLEVVEHVADQRRFIAALAGALAPGGLLVLSTPNRTAWSRLGLIGVAEGLRRIPRGTHDWDRFVTPAETGAMLEAAGLRVTDTRGIALSPTRGFVLSDSTALNYILTAVHA